MMAAAVPVVSAMEEMIMSVSASRTVPEYKARGHQVVKELHSEYQHIVIAKTPEFGHLL